MHSSEVKEDTHDSFRRITAEVICAGENELRVRVAAPSLLGEMPVWIHRDGVNSEFDEILCYYSRWRIAPSFSYIGTRLFG